jgi:hypothetical protein
MIVPGDMFKEDRKATSANKELPLCGMQGSSAFVVQNAARTIQPPSISGSTVYYT